jgi:hypothetical protein
MNISVEMWEETMVFQLARNGTEFRKLKQDKSGEVKIIRSLKEWNATLISPADEEARSHPLHALSLDEIAHFSSELVFRDGGLAGAYIGDLADRLSYNDFRALWAMFGIDTIMFDRKILGPDGNGTGEGEGGEAGLAGDFLQDAKCISHGTCVTKMYYWCTSSC